MKILFVSSSNRFGEISPIVQAQANSIASNNISIEFFKISENGMKGYLNAVFPLRRKIQKGKFDIIHAHYSLSGFVAALAGAKPLIVSLMGSDVKSRSLSKFLVRFFKLFFWEVTIVKSADMQRTLNVNNVEIIPNGVNIKKFYPICQSEAIKFLCWNTNTKHILFPSNPSRLEKNYKLLNKSIQLIKYNIEIHFLKDIAHEEVNYYYNAADIIALPSLREGSPNAIKEAMACNRPIVSTNVGDVNYLLENVQGTFISSYAPEDFAIKIEKALQFMKSNGRERIKEIKLLSEDIALRLIEIYKRTLRKK